MLHAINNQLTGYTERLKTLIENREREFKFKMASLSDEEFAALETEIRLTSEFLVVLQDLKKIVLR